MKEQRDSWGMWLGAWGVHLFTSSGIVAGFFAIVAISGERFAEAFFWLFVALIIDGVDGTFARMFRVSETLPQMSGKTIDYVVDFCNYAVVPAYLIYAAKVDGAYLLPEAHRAGAAVVILLVSAIYYGKDGMVSNDYYFVGFPVMWNLVAFYLYYVFPFSDWGNLVAVWGFAIAHFVPLKYLYPSRTKKFQLLNISASVLALVSNFGLMLWREWPIQHAVGEWTMRALSLLSLGYFGVLAVYHTYFDAETRGR